MPRIGDTADIESILRHVGETGALPEPYAADPGQLFLAIHDQWVENGGRIRGKRRNSIQNLMELLKADGRHVSSLRSKLKGETRLKESDAAALLDTYFSKWRFETVRDGGGQYAALGFDKLDEIRASIIRCVFGDQVATLLPGVETRRKSKVKNAEAEPIDSAIFLAGRDLISENFRESKALVHVSRTGSVVGPNNAESIRGFCGLMDDYWKIDRRDDIGRILIWMVDPGDRDINNSDSLAAFANAEQLATFFRAVRLLNDPQSEDRWQWLAEHAVVLVGSVEAAVTDRLYASDSIDLEDAARAKELPRRGIKHSHFLLDTPPPTWLRSLQFAQLYGEDLEFLEQGSFLLWLDEAETQWRYFGYAPANPPLLAKDGMQSYTKFLELDSPGPIHDRAAAVVYAAACFRLNLHDVSISKDDLLQSIMILRHLDFAVFRLSEFLNAETLSKHPP